MPTPAQTRELWGAHYEIPEAVPTHAPVPSASPGPASRGFTWLKLLSGVDTPDAVIASVRMAVTDQAVYLAVVPDPASPYPRARHGEVGLAECLALAQTLQRVVAEDAARPQRRAIVAVVDLPSQAYGRIEETAGLHQAASSPTDCKRPGSWRSTPPAWRSTPCTNRPPPASPAAPWTSSNSSAPGSLP